MKIFKEPSDPPLRNTYGECMASEFREGALGPTRDYNSTSAGGWFGLRGFGSFVFSRIDGIVGM